jgi:hypothetical protein
MTGARPPSRPRCGLDQELTGPGWPAACAVWASLDRSGDTQAVRRACRGRAGAALGIPSSTPSHQAASMAKPQARRRGTSGSPSRPWTGCAGVGPPLVRVEGHGQAPGQAARQAARRAQADCRAGRRRAGLAWPDQAARHKQLAEPAASALDLRSTSPARRTVGTASARQAATHKRPAEPRPRASLGSRWAFPRPRPRFNLAGMAKPRPSGEATRPAEPAAGELGRCWAFASRRPVTRRSRWHKREASITMEQPAWMGQNSGSLACCTRISLA